MQTPLSPAPQPIPSQIPLAQSDASLHDAPSSAAPVAGGGLPAAHSPRAENRAPGQDPELLKVTPSHPQ